jgi:dienelactone hydrolase
MTFITLAAAFLSLLPCGGGFGREVSGEAQSDPLRGCQALSHEGGGEKKDVAGESGRVDFKPLDQNNVPPRYRLAERSFDYTLKPFRDLTVSGVEIYQLTFPSPVISATPENNTVYAEYYRPKGDGPFPAVVVLDITGGDQSLSRFIARTLAQNRIAGLFVQMAYYGPRRPPGSRLRMLSTDIPHTMAAVRQTVLDCRYAAAWLADRAEVDAKRIGIMGTSLGSFIATLTAEMEPRFSRVAILLGGGGLVDAFYGHPQAAPYVRFWELLGGNKEQVKKGLAPVDPITKAGNLQDRSVLMIAAFRDEIVPPSAAVRLWEEMGEPPIVWYNTTHYGAALYIPAALKPIIAHFGAE